MPFLSPNTQLFAVAYLLTLLLAPLIALSVQDRVNRWREARQRKISIFRTLMATRAARVDPRHVEALNAVQVEFLGGGAGKGVLEKWKEHLDHLNTPQNQFPSLEAWVQKSDEHFIDLLYEMGKCVDCPLDRVELRRRFYRPVAHGEMEMEESVMRKALVEVLTSQRPLKMEVVSFPVDEKDLEEQKYLRKLSTEYFEGKRSVTVTVVQDRRAKEAESST
jgi:hypothetical protein